MREIKIRAKINKIGPKKKKKHTQRVNKTKGLFFEK
jgi:hypothetical protein